MRGFIVVLSLALSCGDPTPPSCVDAPVDARAWASIDVYMYAPGELCIYDGRLWQAKAYTLGPPGPNSPVGEFWPDYWIDLGTICAATL